MQGRRLLLAGMAMVCVAVGGRAAHAYYWYDGPPAYPVPAYPGAYLPPAYYPPPAYPPPNGAYDASPGYVYYPRHVVPARPRPVIRRSVRAAPPVPPLPPVPSPFAGPGVEEGIMPVSVPLPTPPAPAQAAPVRPPLPPAPAAPSRDLYPPERFTD